MKKLFPLILALVLCLGLVTVASAATEISGIKTTLAYNTDINFSDSIVPGKVMEFPLTANMFEWSDGSAGKSNGAVTKTQLNAAKVTAKSSGTDVNLIKSLSVKEKAFSVSNNTKTAYVELVFKDDNVSTTSKDFRFTIYLTYNNNRVDESKAVIEGTFANNVKTCTADDDYVDISKGEVLQPKEYIKSIDIDLGEGIIIRTRVYSDKKYYGIAREGILSEDENVVNKYPSISHIIRLTTTNLKSTGNIVLFDGYSNFHVYDINGKYLGQTDDLLPYSDKYYLFRQKVNMGSTATSSSSSSASSSSGGSLFSSSSSSSTSTATVVAGAAITRDYAVSQTQAAVSSAKSSGYKTTTVRFKDYGSISAEALRAMNQTGANSGVAVSLIADTMNGNSVTGRLTLNTASAANLSSDIKLGVRVDGSNVSSTKQKFNRWFANRIVVVSLDQKGNYGMTAKIAVKVDLSGMSTKNLRFYAYNSAKNEYAIIQAPNYSIDTNGYLHFSTNSAGEIIISDGALTKS